jgi:hypothetical protein
LIFLYSHQNIIFIKNKKTKKTKKRKQRKQRKQRKENKENKEINSTPKYAYLGVLE